MDSKGHFGSGFIVSTTAMQWKNLKTPQQGKFPKKMRSRIMMSGRKTRTDS
jgi:hypothetical protein